MGDRWPHFPSFGKCGSYLLSLGCHPDPERSRGGRTCFSLAVILSEERSEESKDPKTRTRVIPSAAEGEGPAFP